MSERTLETHGEVAYHEAGHCVAGLKIGLPINLVTIIPAEGCLGRVEHRHESHHLLVAREIQAGRVPDGDPAGWRSLVLGLHHHGASVVDSLLAGHVADWLWECGTGCDFSDIALSIAIASKDPNATCGDVEAATTIASAIRKPRFVQRFLQSRTKRTEDLLWRHWAAVEALASALLEAGEIEGEECANICRRAMPGSVFTTSTPKPRPSKFTREIERLWQELPRG